MLGKYIKLMVVLFLLVGCKVEQSDSQGKYAACLGARPGVCVEASGINSTRVNSNTCVGGSAVPACPKVEVMGRCVNNKGTAEEALVYYYSSNFTADDARKDCLEVQSYYNGIFLPN